jgi:hypothetical protein
MEHSRRALAELLKWPAGLALLAALALVQGCGGSGGDTARVATATTGTNTVVRSGANVQPISVNSGLGGTVNLAFTSVTLCVPGGNDCAVIDNVLIDTGSSGLRIMSEAIPATLALLQQRDTSGNAVVECGHFVDGHTWGPVKLADLKMAGEKASSLPIQVIGDPQFSGRVPGQCSGVNNKPKNSVKELRANGILGLAIFRQDCGPACAVPNNSLGIYYACPASTACQPAAVPLESQLQHPVAKFDADNNGVIIELPSVPAGGAAKTLDGSLVFGIGTQANNAIGSATVIGVDPGTANFTTVYNGTSYNASFIDSGSNAYFFADAGTPVCTDPVAAGFYCPAVTKSLSATIQGRNGRSAAIGFSLANATGLVTGNPGFAALGSLGAPQISANSFDWGLPFFYGRNVFIAIDGANTPGGGVGPYIAF